MFEEDVLGEEKGGALKRSVAEMLAVVQCARVLVMDANPGRIIADIKIDESFPRDRSSASFVEYRNDILNKLHFAGNKNK